MANECFIDLTINNDDELLNREVVSLTDKIDIVLVSCYIVTLLR